MFKYIVKRIFPNRTQNSNYFSLSVFLTSYVIQKSEVQQLNFRL